VSAAANRLMLRKLAVFAVGMFGFGFALVPLYNKICEVTGVNAMGVADAAPANTQVDYARNLTVEFDSNLRSELPWEFRPLSRKLKVHPGELTQVVYEVRNKSDQPVTGQAIPSYGPQLAARYFRKLECFCFNMQTLQPGEIRQMPVVFVVDPELPSEVNTVTLSYTFFQVTGRDGGGA
jgi:cytochrome c oxidase assembly protein subunit 11